MAGSSGRCCAGRQRPNCSSRPIFPEAWWRAPRAPRGSSPTEEWLPIRAASLDLVVSTLSLHWVNDLPGALVQIRQALRPDGLLLAALLGGDTLFELREAFLRAESGREGGVRPHVSPFPDVETLGALLQRTGFALPVVDSDRITVTYESAEALMHDLRAMGEANATRGRARHFARRETLRALDACYREVFGQADGRIPATFQVHYLTGWCPHESQQQPAAPGERVRAPSGGSQPRYALAPTPSIGPITSLDRLGRHDAWAEQAGDRPGQAQQRRGEAAVGRPAVNDEHDMVPEAGHDLGRGSAGSARPRGSRSARSAAARRPRRRHERSLCRGCGATRLPPPGGPAGKAERPPRAAAPR